MEQQLLNYLTKDDTLRNQAVSQVEQQCSIRPDDYAKSLCGFLLNSSQNTDPQLEAQRLQLREISSLILHKNLLSKDENFSKISGQTLIQISDSVFGMVNTSAETMNWGLLKRSSEILVEIAVKCDQTLPFFQKLKVFQLEVLGNRKGQKGFVKQAKFGLYSLELLCEYSLNPQTFEKNTGEFLMVFEACFSSDQEEIRSFSTGAICMFLVTQVDANHGNNFQGLLEALVGLLIESIKGIDYLKINYNSFLILKLYKNLNIRS